MHGKFVHINDDGGLENNWRVVARFLHLVNSFLVDVREIANVVSFRNGLQNSPQIDPSIGRDPD